LRRVKGKTGSRKQGINSMELVWRKKEGGHGKKKKALEPHRKQPTKGKLEGKR